MRSLPTTFMQKKRHNIWILLMSLALFLLAAVLRIFLHVRLPRTLAVSGVIIQSVLANPLAGPNIIGVNAGAGFFVVLCAAFLPRWPAAVPTAAFLGALAAMLLVYAIARATRASRIALVLSGVAVSSVLSAGIDAVVTLLPDTLTGASSFRIGGFCLCLRCAGPDSVCAVRAAGGDCHVFFGRPVFSVSSHPAQRGADRQWLN